jgi:Sec-independent protein translocase protein TatA
MFGIGLSEIILVGLIIIVFIRPGDLPKFLHTAGKLYGKAKRAYNDLIAVKDQIIKEIDQAATLDETPPPTETPALPEKPASLPVPAKDGAADQERKA